MNIASVYTVGDLSKEDAAEFYRGLLNESLHENLGVTPGFEEAYRVLGGHMFHIELFVSDFAITQGSETLNSFSPLHTAISQFDSALQVTEFQTGASERPKWTTEYLLSLMERFVTQPFIPYREAALMMEVRGEVMVRSLIRHDVLQYRHNKNYAFDFPDAPNGSIVCPQSPLERYAMEQVLKKHY
jgi:hypothetical protein